MCEIIAVYVYACVCQSQSYVVCIMAHGTLCYVVGPVVVVVPVGSVPGLPRVDRVCVHAHTGVIVEESLRSSPLVGQVCDGQWYVG